LPSKEVQIQECEVALQRGHLSKNLPIVGDYGIASESVRITVFTSSHCSFCNEAIRVIEETLSGLPFYEPFVEVVQTAIEDQPELIENLDILAVPTIFVAKTRIIGLPRTEDVEQLIHQEMLSMASKRKLKT
jgi:protein-disulfide isomerase